MSPPFWETHEPIPPDDLCPLCLTHALEGRHCKRVCPACGYTESCEDVSLNAGAPPCPPTQDG